MMNAMPDFEDGPEGGENKEVRKRIMKAMKEAQVEQQRKALLRQVLDDKAYERMMNVRASNYELYKQLVGVIASLAQSNRIQGKLTEPQFISILTRLTSRPESQISFKRK
jgi:DNA-binding protein